MKLFLDSPCAAACGFPAMIAVSPVDPADAHPLVSTCLNHAHVVVAQALAHRGPSAACLACGGDAPHALRFRMPERHGSLEASLCGAHVAALLTHTLTPKAWTRLCAAWGGDAEAVFLLHSDFYTEEGDAVQPQALLGATRLRAELRGMAELPAFNDAGYYDLPLRMITTVQEDYRAETGLVIEQPLAESIAQSIVLWASIARDQEARQDAGALPTEGDREIMAQQLLGVLQHHDPFGLVAAGDRNAYAGEAATLSRCLHGDETAADVRRVLAVNLSGFTGTPLSASLWREALTRGLTPEDATDTENDGDDRKRGATDVEAGEADDREDGPAHEVLKSLHQMVEATVLVPLRERLRARQHRQEEGRQSL